MSKPIGLTRDFRVTMPSHAEDDLWRAVAGLQAEGFDLRDIQREVEQAWNQALEDQKAT